MDPTEILSRLGTADSPTDAELRSAFDEFGALMANALEERDRDAARSLRTARQVISEELTRRDEARQAEDAELAELAADLEGDTDEDTDEDETVEAPVAPSEPEVLDLAAIRAASREARANIEAKNAPVNPYPHVRVKAVGPASGEAFTTESSMADVARIFSQHARSRDKGRQTLLSMSWDLPEDRMLGPEADKSTRKINDLLAGATSFEAVAASGQVCGPLSADYNVPLIGSTTRPIRDTAMVRYGGERGGIQYTPAPRLSTSGLSSAVAIWPNGSESPGDKPCLHVDCSCTANETVEAITGCLTVGNFLARFSPEQWEAALHQLAVNHARLGEDYLLARIDAASVATTTLTHAQGTIAGILDAVARGSAGIRSRDRRLEDVGFRVILEGWLRNAMRAQFGLQAAAGNPSAVAIADQAINAWFANYGASVTWTWDDSIFGAQNTTPAALVGYPSTTKVRIYPEGTFGFIDGGTLDLGTDIVDLDLIQQNHRAAFMETFEGVLKRTAPCDAPGDDALVVPVAVAADCMNICVAD